MPIWDRFLYKSLCIEVLPPQHHTEPVVAVRIAIVVVRIERTSIRRIIVVAPTFEERIASVQEVRVVSA